MTHDREYESSDWSTFERWDSVLPPNRPGDDDIALLRSMAVGCQGSRALVLGATPEYRSALSTLGFDVTVIDSTPEFFASLSHLLSVAVGGEELVQGDWLEVLPTLRRQFDLVCADLTLGNVPLERQGELQRLTADTLVPGGRLIERTLHYRSGLATEAEIGRFCSRSINLEVANEFNGRAIFCSPVVRELGAVITNDIVAHALDAFPDLEPLVRLTLKYVTPPNSSWSYTGEFRDPLEIYRSVLTSVVEEPRHSAGFGYGISVVMGVR